MFIFEIITPGTWLDYDDSDWSWRIQNQLQSLESQFFEANTALNLFVQAQSMRPSFSDSGTWERDTQRRSEIQRIVEQERGGITFPELWDEIQFETEVRFKREKWSNGGVPREFEHNLPFIYARAFLYALDAFDKFLGVLSKEPNIPGQVAEFHAQIAKEFPHLRSVRNTAQHLEDRARGLGAGKNPQPLDLKPITNNLINAPGGGVLAMNCLNGSKYGSTMSDGHYGEVDVSPESMQRLQKILEGVLHSFKWRGSRRHAPSA
ncbi:hypothetical protein [Chromobacterium amazonense]|uniref:hypothetical protein n=1 Tax=Chromobacterium amazonense TaxID=1382803 RepID=UPI0031F6B209